MKIFMISVALLLSIPTCLAGSSPVIYEPIDLTSSIAGYLSLLVFALAYTLVIFEDQLHLRKSNQSY